VRRGRHREHPAPRPGDLVIDGRLRARLLGLHLLDIDAHVVVAPARTTRIARRGGPSSLAGRDRAREADVPQRTGTGPDGPSPPELAYAARLIAEGSSLLDEASIR
jgi:hypothetical protein